MQILAPPGKVLGHLLVIHSWWGLTGSFRDYGGRLAQAGFVVGLADLFGGRTACTEAEARALRAAPRRKPMYKTLIADIAELREMHGSTTQIGIIGFSMGGHWAVWLSQRADLPIRSVVIYYAARAGDFSAGKASYLAHFAENDHFVSAAARRSMEKAIKRAGLAYTAHDYSGTGHWFAETDRKTDYDTAAADLAFSRTVDHLRRD